MPTLDWLNRAAAFKIAKDVPYRLLELVSEHRAARTHDISAQSTDVKPEPQGTLDLDAATTPQTPAGTHDNLLIQGDNLEGLKALLPFYRGQVKCIVIDPPYNTKSAFEHYDDNLEQAWLSYALQRPRRPIEREQF